ncbi:MAG: hypothetical protein J6X01_04650 [Bacteroidales bacterium]|nr:hypothetical protein [Bacteroidales bacterium]
MKKLLLSFLLLCTILVVQAQERYHVGQMVPQGKFIAMVIYVDETGEHGLMISPVALPENNLLVKDMLKARAKEAGVSVEDYIPQLPTPLMVKGEKDSKIAKVQKAMMAENLNGTSGEENCKNIVSYCSKNGISLDDYFPEVAWAISLGEGWFIPGMDEIEIYANVITNGAGVGLGKFTGNKADQYRQELQKQAIDNSSVTLDKALLLRPGFPQRIGSSTFAGNKNFEKDPANNNKIYSASGGLLGYVKDNYFGLALTNINRNGEVGNDYSYIYCDNGVNYRGNTYAFKRF